MHKSFSSRLFFFIFFLFISNTALASFNKNLWPIWQMTNPLSTEVIDHQEWQAFLTKHVVSNKEGINLVVYSSLTEADVDLLKNYISNMSKVNIDNYNRSEQLAYWLNLYNAVTVHTIASYYPVGSIEEINISPGLFSVGPWGAKLITINNIPLSLDEIHNRIIRPIWNDVRTHYAINNGAIGAPNLSKEAFRGSSMDMQLNQAATDYINSFRGAQVIEGKLIVSKIYEWFSDDFGGTKQHIITHLELFAKEPLINQLKHINTIDSYVYNWHLNSTIDGNHD